MSHDSTQTPDFSKTPSDPGKTPSDPGKTPKPSFKLDDVLKPITTQFKETQLVIEGVQESVEKLSSKMQTGFASIDLHIETAIAAADKRQEIRDNHKANIDLVNKITIAQ